MFGLFSKKQSILDSGLLQGFTDHHSHLLPGVDDGFQTATDTLEALRVMEDAGVADVWLTPHIMEDVPNTVEGLKKRFNEFSAEYNGGVRLHLAAENMMDGIFTERWKQRDILMLGDASPLIETSYFRAPIEMRGLIGEMLNAGLRPILAHPERYKYMEQSDYEELKQSGVLFQLNLGSSAGCYSKHTKEKAEWLLSNGFYDLMGSDIHNLRFYNHTVNEPLRQKIIDAMRQIPNQL